MDLGLSCLEIPWHKQIVSPSPRRLTIWVILGLVVAYSSYLANYMPGENLYEKHSRTLRHNEPIRPQFKDSKFKTSKCRNHKQIQITTEHQL